MKQKIINKRDIILLCAMLIGSLLLLLLFSALAGRGGETAVVTVDGKEYARLPLSEDTELPIETEWGKNLLVIEDGKAYISEADCPDRICVKTGKATELKSVVCLPHRLTVSIEEAE